MMRLPPFYPSGRAALLLALAAPFALVVAAAAPDAWLVAPALAATLLVLVVLDAVLATRLADVRVIVPHQGEVGEPLDLTVLTDFAGSPGRRAEAALALDPRLGGGGRITLPLVREPGSGAWSGTAALIPTRRGTAPVSRVWLRWRGPLGLCWRQEARRLTEQVLIRPSLAATRSPALQAILRDAQFGLIARRIRGEGSQFEALAEYQSGMDRRRIDWKASARHSHLYAKEYETERNNQIVFAFDCGQTMCEPVDGLPRIDRAVSAALATAYVAMKAGDRVMLYGFAARPEVATPFFADARQFHRLQSAAASLDYHAEEANFTLALTGLSARLKRRSLVILFADFTDPTSAELMLENVGRLVEKHRVLFVVMQDAELEALTAAEPESVQAIGVAVAADAMARQRATVLLRLKRMGVAVVEAPHRAIGTRLIDAYLAIKRAGTIG